MARREVNRSGEMEVFVRVVELGGFSPAARTAGLTPSAVSKLISRLEARLGARLLNRSTRQVQLTPEGCAFYERAGRILADLAEAEQSARAGEDAAGRIRLNTSASYAAHVLAPLLPGFLARYPGITLDLVQTDAVVDLVADRSDIAVRAGPLPASGLIARKLGDAATVIVASPAYLARHGEPARIAELAGHRLLGFGYARADPGWALIEDGRVQTVMPDDRLRVSDGEGLRAVALAGAGITRLTRFSVGADLAAGRLRAILTDQNARHREAFHAVFLGQGTLMPARMRAMLDFLAEHGRV